MRRKAGGKHWKERGKRRGKEAQDAVIYTSISEYWNNSNAAFPTFVPRRFYIHEDIRAIARNTTFFTVRGSFFPRGKGWNGQLPTVCGKRRLKATVRNSSPFVEYQAGANRCLQLGSVPRFRAIRGYPIFFHR